MTTTGSRWNQVAGRAAIVNGAVFVVVPFVLFTYANYTSDLVRPRPRTLLTSAASAVQILVGNIS